MSINNYHDYQISYLEKNKIKEKKYHILFNFFCVHWVIDWYLCYNSTRLMYNVYPNFHLLSF